MSLQAKIEAVIYASEEPVTLPQLMRLLGEEAQAELDALDAQQGSLALEDGEAQLEDSDVPAGEAAGGQDALNAEVMDDPALEREETEDVAAAGENADSSAALRNDNQDGGDCEESVGSRESGDDPSGDSRRDEELAADGVAPPAAAEEKKLSRERERRLREYFRSLLDRLIAEYANSDRGLEIREVAGGFRLATKPEYHDTVRGFVKSLKPPLKLSLQALETLAVIAYKQPVTAPEIGEIRGVDSGGVLGSLLARKLITTAGRKAVIGRPILYKTTKEFLVRFGLKDIHELPSIEEFEKMAGELNDSVQEEIPMSAATDDVSETGEKTSEETGQRGSSALDELNSPPTANDMAESADEVMSPRSAGTEGAKTEPSSGVSQEAAESVERMRDVHEAQADGVPESPATPRQNAGFQEARHMASIAVDNHEPYTGDDETGA